MHSTRDHNANKHELTTSGILTIIQQAMKKSGITVQSQRLKYAGSS